ncbi:hypothetical protein SH1V18_38810 [Vallitalea longa]|uniref:Uncharacterized protein n=1 Tax=Vallitalea longa TaxID=2936439 RepID=A0A9W5YEV9_9FIRM|nr:hypothetical protein [Vallitalea longa]GKX31401.1 hypothetical protein SH1V18_38810 [Vallitalea longa]
MSNIKQYENICTSLIKLLEVDEQTSKKISNYILDYGVENFLKNIELMDFTVDITNKLLAVQDILMYVQNATARYGG